MRSKLIDKYLHTSHHCFSLLWQFSLPWQPHTLLSRVTMHDHAWLCTTRVVHSHAWSLRHNTNSKINLLLILSHDKPDLLWDGLAYFRIFHVLPERLHACLYLDVPALGVFISYWPARQTLSNNHYKYALKTDIFPYFAVCVCVRNILNWVF